MTKNFYKILLTLILSLSCFWIAQPVEAANNFTSDSSVAGLYKLESGALTTDSSPVVGCNGANTLTNSATPVTASVTAKEGTYSGAFVAASSEYLSQTDANLCSGFPGKNGTSNTTFAVSLWFKLGSLPAFSAEHALVSKYNSSTSQRSFYLRYFNSGGTRVIDMILGYNSGASAEIKTLYTGDLLTTSWYHLGFSYNGASKAYIAKLVKEDGTVMANVSSSYTNTMSVRSGSFGIGSVIGTDWSRYFDGLVDEVVIFNTTKTATDFDNIRNGSYSVLAPLNAPTLSTPANSTPSVALDTNLTWTDTNTSPNDSGYYICIDTSNTSPPAHCTTVSADVTSVSAATALGSALSGATTYYWTVKALGDSSTTGDSSYATNYNFTTVLPAPTTYCIDATGGLDSNTGTSANGTCSDTSPWQSISKVNTTTLYAGDHVLLKKGQTWSEQLTISNSGVLNTPIVIDAYGTGANPILTGGTYGVYATGQSNLSINNLTLNSASTANFSVSSGANIDINNITSTGSATGIILDTISGTLIGTGWTVSGTSADGVDISNTTATMTLSNINLSGGVGNNFYILNSILGSGSTITSLTADAAAGMNVKIVGVQNLEMIDSVASNATYTGTPATGEGYWVGQNSSNIIFTRCTAHGNQWDGFTTKDTGVTNIIYNRCSSYNNGIVSLVSGGAGDGYTAHSNASGLQYNYCLAYGNKNTGFAFIETSSGKIYNSVAYNNGIATSDRGGFYALNTAGAWTLKNNIFSQNIPHEYVVSAAEEALIDTDYNLYYHPANNNIFSIDGDSTFLSWTTYHTTDSKEPHSLYGDPLFTSTVTPDFHLQSLSPAINAGVNLSLTGGDIEGRAIIGLPDMGAYEYASNDATVTSSAYTVSALSGGAGTITNVPSGTSKADFLAALTLATGASWNTNSVANPVVSTNTLVVTAEDETTIGTYTITVNKTTPTLSVTNSPATYNASPQAAAVSGSVAGTASNVQYNGSGTTPTNVGTYAITADFTPDDTTNYNSLTGASAGDFVISKADQSALTAVSTPSTVTYGTTATLSSTGGSGTGVVTFSAGASTGCNITSGTTLNVSDASGTCTVTATKAADTNYNSANSAGLTVPLAKAAQSTLTFTGQTVTSPSTFSTLSTTGGTGTGTVTYAVTTAGTAGCSIADTTLSYTTAGTCGVTATKAADSNYSSASSSEATFTINAASPITYTITSSAGSHGSISPSGATTVNNAENQSFTITADSGYHISDVLVDSVSVSAVSSYQFSNVTANHTITATFAVTSSGGGGCYNCYVNPSIPSGGFKMSINGEALTTSNRNVFLGFNAGADIKKMAISMTGDFTDASQENYVASRQWDLCSKLGGAVKNPTCPDGKYTVYAKFYTAYGRSSDTSIASSTITLKSGATSVENLQQYANLPFTNSFTKYLQYRQTNADIKRLQIFLNANPDTKVADTGAGSPGKETNYFGLLTYKAVIKFQEKYAKDILVPWGFKKGTGYVGKTTLAKINELMKSK